MNKIIIFLIMIIVIFLIIIYNYNNIKIETFNNDPIDIGLAFSNNNIEVPNYAINDNSITNNTNTNMNTNTIVSKYNPFNYDITYHKEYEPTNISTDNYKVSDINGNIIDINRLSIEGKPTYDNTKKYIPNYEDSIFLSKTTNNMTYSNNLEFNNKYGFCENNKNELGNITLEERCNNLDGNICASTNCCVLFGGQKCVAGNEKGPNSKKNYYDITIKNKDFYYYQGKCYGNC